MVDWSVTRSAVVAVLVVLAASLIAYNAYNGGLRGFSAGGGSPGRGHSAWLRAGWSPDGRRRVFVSDRDAPRSHPCHSPSSTSTCPLALYVVNADGTGERRLTPLTWSSYEPVWAPSGREIAFVGFTRAGRYIYVMNSEGSRRRRLTRNTEWETQPAWSPRGDLIAFTYQKGFGEADVRVVSPTGTRQRVLAHVATMNANGTDGTTTFGGPVWSPDGRLIAFNDGGRGAPGIFLTDTRGTRRSRVTWNRRSLGPVSWSPNGRWIAFSARTFENGEFWLGSGVFVVARDGTGLRRLTHSWQAGSPVWSPSGTRIAYDAGSAIFVIRPDGTGSRRLTRSGGPRVGSRNPRGDRSTLASPGPPPVGRRRDGRA